MRYITFTNKGSLDICKNMLISAKLNRVDDITVYALDEESFDELSHFDCKVERYQTNISEEYHSYGSSEFKSLMTVKLNIMLKNIS